MVSCGALSRVAKCNTRARESSGWSSDLRAFVGWRLQNLHLRARRDIFQCWSRYKRWRGHTRGNNFLIHCWLTQLLASTCWYSQELSLRVLRFCLSQYAPHRPTHCSFVTFCVRSFKAFQATIFDLFTQCRSKVPHAWHIEVPRRFASLLARFNESNWSLSYKASALVST